MPRQLESWHMKLLLTLAVLALVVGCSEAPTTTAEKKTPKTLEPLTGRQAFQRMYVTARLWAPDCEGLELKSLQLSTVKAGPGQAGVWQCKFVSAARGRVRAYTWSAIDSEEEGLHQGVFGGQEEAWSGPQGQSRPFLIQALKIDSDQAYDTAAKKSEEFLKTKPTKPVNYILALTPRFPDLTWRVMWGETVGTSDYSVFVDATTGIFLERVH
jgi:hypothetical protein